MPSSIGRTTFALLGGIVIVVIAFLATTYVLNYWATSQQPIHITEATYGNNCTGFKAPSGQIDQVTPGNATSVVAKACENASGSCTYLIDGKQLGDPAPGCPKAFKINYRCGDDPTIHEVALPGGGVEGKSAQISCPARP